jgi:hypothetical protein
LKLGDALPCGRLDPAHIGTVTWAPRNLWRVYARQRSSLAFNGSRQGSSRFSPVECDGLVVPVLYAGTTVEVALMETVLHDAPPHTAGYQLWLDHRTERRQVAVIRTTADLCLADLSTLGLRRLGLSRTDVIDCCKTGYALTRGLATWIYANCPHAQGIAWTSRQDDTGQALMLFEPRLRSGFLAEVNAGESFLDEPHLSALVGLIDRLGAALVIE